VVRHRKPSRHLLRHSKVVAVIAVLGLTGAIVTAFAGTGSSDPEVGNIESFHSHGHAHHMGPRGIPRRGALVGAAYRSNTDPAPWEKAMGRRLGVRRTFWRADQVKSAVHVAAQDIRHHRRPWLSFKMPYSWSEMAAGRGDRWARLLAVRLSRLNGPVWVAFHHEPEGDGNIKKWTAMQAHLAPIVRRNAANVAYSIILTGWNQLYGPPQYNLNALWPRHTKIDLVGFDIYNKFGVVKNGRTFRDSTHMRKDYFRPLSRWAKEHHVAWGLAETGITDKAARDRPRMLGRTYRSLRATGGVAFSYFNTNLNSVAHWSLDSSSKKGQFNTVLRSSPAVKGGRHGAGSVLGVQ
jgi:hypothetical protein